MEGYEIKFNIYAMDKDEALRAEGAIKNFINQLAMNGRAVSGDKIVGAVNNWQANPIVRNHILNYFRQDGRQ